MSLARVFLGSLARRRAATLLSFFAIVLGVALGMAVQVVHEAALDEFGQGLRKVAGTADLQVSGPRGGFDEALYPRLAALPEVAEVSPVVEVEARLPGREESLTVMGVDVFSLAQVSPALMPVPAPGEDRLAVLDDGVVFLSPAALNSLGASVGGQVILLAGLEKRSFRVAGLVPGMGDNRQLAVMDIAGAQWHFGQLGRLSRLDVKLAQGVTPQAGLAAVEKNLPAGVVAQVPEAAERQAAALSRSYRVNLTLLAAIALITGGFLVFSAQALSVVRRRTEFAFLRALGLDRRTLFRWLLGEGAVIGTLGGLVGTALGYGLAWGALQLLGGDLGAGFFAGLAPTLTFSPGVAVGYALLGTAAGVAGAWIPAREAAQVSPARALKAMDDGGLAGGKGLPWLAVAVLGLAGAACLLPPVFGLPLGGYAAVLGLLGGGVLLLPSLARLVALVLPPGEGVTPSLVRARLGQSPGHAVMAAAGVLVSVALAGAMAIMVASFRDSVDAWLTQVLPADIYVRAGQGRTSDWLDPAAQARIAALPGVGEVDFARHDSLRLSPDRPPVGLIARRVSADGRELPLVGRPVPVGDRPAVWISEAVEDLFGWSPGDQVSLPLAGRQVPMVVAGVWRDYVRQQGAVMLDLALYRQLTGDMLADDGAIHLAPGGNASEVMRALRRLPGGGALEIARPGEIRAVSLAMFDRTFAVTYLLEAVAVAIGLAGVAASFAALAAARRREFGMLRHLGLTRGQIGRMLALEGGVVAGTGVVGGLLTGAAISLVLIEVINRQSFHWSMDWRIPYGGLALFGATLVGLAALAAVLAGRQAMGQNAVLAVREDW